MAAFGYAGLGAAFLTFVLVEHARFFWTCRRLRCEREAGGTAG